MRTTMEPPRGSSKVTYTRNGRRQGLSYGPMGIVWVSKASSSLIADGPWFNFRSGIRQECPLVGDTLANLC